LKNIKILGGGENEREKKLPKGKQSLIDAKICLGDKQS